LLTSSEKRVQYQLSGRETTDTGQAEPGAKRENEMAMKIQVSLGYGSMGMAYRDLADDEIPAMVAAAAAEMGYGVDVVSQKLTSGGTLWLSRADGIKIRGYDADAAQDRAVKLASDRQRRMSADGYGRDK
jgi:hypothetical protein